MTDYSDYTGNSSQNYNNNDASNKVRKLILRGQQRQVTVDMASREVIEVDQEQQSAPQPLE